MKLLFCVFIFLIARTAQPKVSGFTLDSADTIGCSLNTKNLDIKLSGSVYASSAYLNSLSKNNSDSFIQQQIENQIKYLIGSSKKYQPTGLSRFSVSAQRQNLVYSIAADEQLEVPTLDEFWNSNISWGQSDYIHFLKSISGSSSPFAKINFSVLTNISACYDKSILKTDADLFLLIQKIPIPKDPNLGFWINSKSERTQLKIKDGIGFSGVVPNCLSKDILIYKTSPDYAWYYWQMGLEMADTACTKNTALLTKYGVELVKTHAQLNEDNYFLKNRIKNISLFFGQNRTRTPAHPYLYSKDFLKKMVKASAECKKIELKDCLLIWESRFQLSGDVFDLRAQSTIENIKFIHVFLKDITLKIHKSGPDYFLLTLTGKERLKNKAYKINIYYGRTGNSQNANSNEFYWSHMYTELLKTDALFYIGHAGAGRNLSLKNILAGRRFSLTLPNRKQDLLLGVFNCESHAYFGYDLFDVFEPSKSFELRFFASTGVGTNSLFVTTLLESIFTETSLLTTKNRLSNLVKTQDFLVFQHLKK